MELRGEFNKPKDSGLEYEKGIRSSPEKDQKWIRDGEQNKYKNPKAPDPGSQERRHGGQWERGLGGTTVWVPRF